MDVLAKKWAFLLILFYGSPYGHDMILGNMGRRRAETGRIAVSRQGESASTPTLNDLCVTLSNTTDRVEGQRPVWCTKIKYDSISCPVKALKQPWKLFAVQPAKAPKPAPVVSYSIHFDQ